jgi:hypothetical protein
MLIEKSMTYSWPWDYAEIRTQKEKGAQVRFKWWAKKGLSVELTFFGSYMIGEMFTLMLMDESKVTFPQLFPADRYDELGQDIAFPIVNLLKIDLQDGYSAEETENPRMQHYIEEDILEALSRDDENNKKIAKEQVIANSDETSDKKVPATCKYCGECPCVWLRNIDTVIAVDENEHAGMSTVNSAQRKVAYKHMFRVVNDPGQKNVRKKHSECVLNGVRALFPDQNSEYMGFREA